MNAEPLPPFKSVRYAAAAPGTRLVVCGAVHGNETCGTRAIERVMAELEAGQLALAAGSVSFVPIANAKAYALRRRAGDRNLNRALQPTPEPREFEDHVANWLCPLLAAHDVLLDLHSFHSGGRPFVMVGPRDNDGPLEPFAHAAQEEALARRLGVGRAVDGWLDTYAKGVGRRRRQAAADSTPPATLELDLRYGIGTTEYMRTQGGCALTLECGPHDDPQSVDVAHDAIRRAMATLGISTEAPPPPAPLEALSLVEVVDKVDAADRFSRGWHSFDPLRAGDEIGRRASGEVLRAPFDGWIVFPYAQAEARQEWYYLARASRRFDG